MGKQLDIEGGNPGKKRVTEEEPPNLCANPLKSLYDFELNTFRERIQETQQKEITERLKPILRVYVKSILKSILREADILRAVRY